MYGVIFDCLETFVSSQFGLAIWETAAAKAFAAYSDKIAPAVKIENVKASTASDHHSPPQCQEQEEEKEKDTTFDDNHLIIIPDFDEAAYREEGWLVSFSYPDGLFLSLCDAIAVQVSLTSDEITRGCGAYFVNFIRCNPVYDNLLRCQGATLKDWISRVNSFHTHLRDTLPYGTNFVFPEIFCIDDDDVEGAEQAAILAGDDAALLRAVARQQQRKTAADDKKASWSSSSFSPLLLYHSSPRGPVMAFFLIGIVEAVAEAYFDSELTVQKLKTQGEGDHGKYTVWRITQASTTDATQDEQQAAGSAGAANASSQQEVKGHITTKDQAPPVGVDHHHSPHVLLPEEKTEEVGGVQQQQLRCPFSNTPIIITMPVSAVVTHVPVPSSSTVAKEVETRDPSSPLDIPPPPLTTTACDTGVASSAAAETAALLQREAVAAASLSSEMLQSMFPFHIAIDSDMNIIQLGSRVEKFFPQVSVGRSVSDCFRMTLPSSCDWTLKDMIICKDSMFELQYLAGASSSLARGRFTLIGSLEISVASSTSQQQLPSSTSVGSCSNNSNNGDADVGRAPRPIFILFMSPKISSINEMIESSLTWVDLGRHSMLQRHILLTEHHAAQVADALEVKDQALQIQRTLEMKSMFVRYVSHEIRTPLNTVSMGLELIKATIEASAELTGMVKKQQENLQKQIRKQDLREQEAEKERREEEQERKEGEERVREEETKNNTNKSKESSVSSSPMKAPSRDSFYLRKKEQDKEDIVRKLEREAMSEMVVQVKESCDIAIDLVNDLLLYEKLEGGLLQLERAPEPVLPLVCDAVKTFQIQAKQLGIDLFCTYDDACMSDQEIQKPTVFIDVDKPKISQVIRNMVSNAIKFSVLAKATTSTSLLTATTDGSAADHQEEPSSPVRPSVVVHVTIATTPSIIDVAPAPLLGLLLAGDSVEGGASLDTVPPPRWNGRKYLRIEVIDSGAGISLENQAKLFGSIVQFDAKKLQGGGGSGIGLYISKGIMDLHDGFIGVFSEGEGKGSVFYIDLPLQDPQQQQATFVDHEDGSSGSGGEIADMISAPDFARRSSCSKPAAGGLLSASSSARRFSGLTAPAGGASDRLLKGAAHMVELHSQRPVLLTVKELEEQSGIKNSMSGGGGGGGGDKTDKTFYGVRRIGSNSTVGNELLGPRGSKKKGCKLKLLVVDDSIANRKMVIRFLKINNLCDDVTEAGDGEEALNIIKKSFIEGRMPSKYDFSLAVSDRRRNGALFDGVLMDCIMPVMDGPTSTRLMRKAGFTGPIIGITGNVMDEDKALFMACGATEVMGKPLDMARLTILLEKAAAGSAMLFSSSPVILSRISSSGAIIVPVDRRHRNGTVDKTSIGDVIEELVGKLPIVEQEGGETGKTMEKEKVKKEGRKETEEDIAAVGGGTGGTYKKKIDGLKISFISPSSALSPLIGLPAVAVHQDLIYRLNSRSLHRDLDKLLMDDDDIPLRISPGVFRPAAPVFRQLSFGSHRAKVAVVIGSAATASSVAAATDGGGAAVETIILPTSRPTPIVEKAAAEELESVATFFIQKLMSKTSAAVNAVLSMSSTSNSASSRITPVVLASSPRHSSVFAVYPEPHPTYRDILDKGKEQGRW